MRTHRILVGAVLALPFLLAPAGFAQTKDKKDTKVKPASDDSGGIHQMVIISGANRTVHYFSKDGSPSEQTALRNLERAENEANYADALLDLRRQYVSTESALEARRRQVQLALYGLSVETNYHSSNKIDNTVFFPQSVDAPLNTNFFPSTGFGGGIGPFGFPGTGGFGFPGARGGFPLAFATPASAAPGVPGVPGTAIPGGAGPSAAAGFPFSPFFPGAAGFAGGLAGGFGFPFGYGGNSLGTPLQPYSTDSYNLKTDAKVSRGLEHGIGDEGRFKTEMVAQMARQATPEYSAAANRAYENAVTAVVGAVHSRPTDRVGYANFEQMKPRKAKVKLKDGETLTGLLLREDNDWIVLKTDDSEVRIRGSEVVRISLEPQK